jgi:thioredoxin reductase
MQSNGYDVAIIGGGAAGLSAALVLGRARRRVAVIDTGAPRNAPAAHMHGFLSRDGVPPAQLLATGRAEAHRYAVEFVDDEAVAADPDFTVRLASGNAVRARRLVLATGAVDELPDIPGARERWGRDFLHCPYCHGWEVRDRPLAAYGAGAAHLALLLTSLSDDVVLLTDGSPDLDPDTTERLRQTGVVIRDDPIARLEAEGGKLARVVFADGSSDERAGLFFVPTFTPSPLPAQLGCELDESGALVIDEDGATSVPWVFAAGDATTDKKAVVLAAAAGSRAAYTINAGLANGLLPVAAY